MALSQDFKDYARLSNGEKLYIDHKAVAVTEQAGVVGPYGKVSFSTWPYSIENVSATLTWPDMTDDLNVPGRIGGGELNTGNSLTLPGDTLSRGVLMTGVIVAPDASVDVENSNVLTLSNINNAHRGKVADIDWNIFYLGTGGNMELTHATFAKDDGSNSATYEVATAVKRWEGALRIRYNLALPDAESGDITLNTILVDTIASLGDYRVEVVIRYDGRDIMEPATDTLTLS